MGHPVRTRIMTHLVEKEKLRRADAALLMTVVVGGPGGLCARRRNLRFRTLVQCTGELITR